MRQKLAICGCTKALLSDVKSRQNHHQRILDRDATNISRGAPEVHRHQSAFQQHVIIRSPLFGSVYCVRWVSVTENCRYIAFGRRSITNFDAKTWLDSTSLQSRHNPSTTDHRIITQDVYSYGVIYCKIDICYMVPSTSYQNPKYLPHRHGSRRLWIERDVVSRRWSRVSAAAKRTWISVDWGIVISHVTRVRLRSGNRRHTSA